MRGLVLLFLSITYTIGALYEDQIGLFDWHHQRLGEVSHAVFPSKNNKNVDISKGIYVATKSNVFAKLDSKKSNIEWRHILPENSIDLLHFCDSHPSLLTISTLKKNKLAMNNSTILRQWDAINGLLLWEKNLPISMKQTINSFSKIHEVYGDNNGETSLVLLRNDGIIIIGLKSGNVLKNIRFQSHLSTLLSSKISVDASKLYVLGVDSTNSLPLVYQVNLKTGDLSTIPVENQSNLVGLYREEENNRVVAVGISEQGSVLTLQALYNLELKQTISPSELQLPTTDEATTFLSIESSLRHAFILTLSNGKRLFLRMNGGLKLDILALLPATGLLIDSAQSPGVVFHVNPQLDQNQFSITAYSTTSTDTTTFHASLDLALYGNAIERGFASVSFKKKGAALSTCKIALVMADASLILVSNEKSTNPTNGLVWIREEALAHVEQMFWVTPADLDDGVEKETLTNIPTYMEELAIEAKKLTKFILSLSDIWSSSNVAEKHAITFGFAKLIVLYTSTGKLYGLDSQTGTIVWSRYVGRDHRLLVTRDHPALGAGAELLLVTPSKELLWLDAGHGAVLDHKSVGDGKKWIVLLPKQTHHEMEETVPRRVVGVLDHDTNKMDLYPQGEKVDNQLNSFYIHRYDAEDHAFHGYVMSATDQLDHVWSFVLPQNERIVSQSAQPDHLVIDSAVTVLGDDSLLLKYLNLHLFGVATIDEQGTLHVSLIDGVSGRVIHRVKHHDTAEPVNLVQSENWLVYSFWSTKSKRTELVSLSLFEGGVPANGLNPWKQPYWSSTRTSFDPKLPIVLQKNFIYPATITSLGVTITNQGITPQYILVAQGNGQIFKLGRNFIDPRVPEGIPTPEQQNEGLVQYTQYVPVLSNALQMITYNQTIESIRRIVCAPALLESTSLTFAYGLDLFYVRLAPANAFDVLPSDFNYELLILLCLGFIAAAYLTRILAERKELHEAWK